MDSKYSLIGNNRLVVPKFNIKAKPTPVVFNTNNPPAKKMKLSENEDKTKTTSPVVPKQSLQDQRRSLPIYGVRNRLLDEIKRHQTLIIIGETGSGKTTQIPQFIHSARLQNDAKIGITQPRRVAAITIALRVAQEMGTELGEVVGYTVRFEDVSSRRTKIKYLTDGMLLREAMADSLLMSYNVLILDEAHERTVHTDVLFGIVKEAQKIRQERNLAPLKLLIMSATMDVDHFSRYFNNCKTVYIEGRTHPVDVYHSVEAQEDYQFSCLVTLFKIHREAPPNHDVLIFLTGQEEIEAMVSTIHNISKDPELSKCPAMKVYPLYASLPSEHQLDVFKPTPHNVRKVILSTNIAETSLTITGVRYVIDSGMVKARSYRALTGLDSLKVQRISQAQAWQRTGRAGRDSKGSCYRMFTKAQYQLMRKTTLPEIQRCNLSSVVLQLLALGIHAAKFDFMDKPYPDAVNKAFEQLQFLGAVDSANDTKLTPLGRKMAQFPVDPRFSKILIASQDYSCMEEMLSIVAILSSESVVVTPANKREQATAARQKFTSPHGDHISLLNIYRGFNNAGQKKHWCFENFLNYRNLCYAREVRSQLAEICQRCDIPLSSCGSNMDQVRKCLITGLFMNVAELYRNQVNGSHFVTLDSNQVVSIHPSSVLHGMKPHCVLFTEVVHTSNCYLRFLSTIDPEWLSDIVPEYMKSHHLAAAVRGN